MTSRLRCVIRARGSWAALTALALTHAPAPPLAYAQAAPPSAPASPVPPPAPGSSAAGAVDASLAGGGAAPPPGETAPVASESAPAASDACVAERFIVLESRGFAPDLFAEVRTDFATELRHRGLDVCDAGRPRSARRQPWWSSRRATTWS